MRAGVTVAGKVMLDVLLCESRTMVSFCGHTLGPDSTRVLAHGMHASLLDLDRLSGAAQDHHAPPSRLPLLEIFTENGMVWAVEAMPAGPSLVDYGVVGQRLTHGSLAWLPDLGGAIEHGQAPHGALRSELIFPEARVIAGGHFGAALLLSHADVVAEDRYQLALALDRWLNPGPQEQRAAVLGSTLASTLEAYVDVDPQRRPSSLATLVVAAGRAVGVSMRIAASNDAAALTTDTHRVNDTRAEHAISLATGEYSTLTTSEEQAISDTPNQGVAPIAVSAMHAAGEATRPLPMIAGTTMDDLTTDPMGKPLAVVRRGATATPVSERGGDAQHTASASTTEAQKLSDATMVVKTLPPQAPARARGVRARDVLWVVLALIVSTGLILLAAWR